MATPGGIAAGLLGSAASEAAAFAAGIAIGPALAPEVKFLENEAWAAVTSKPLDAATAAAIAAENVDQYAAMAQQAAYNGVAGPLFQDLYGVTLNAPGTGELLAMLRRGTINPGNFTHGLRKAKLEPMWDAGLADLANQKISATDLAYMMVRGVLPDEGLLGMSLPTQADRLNLPPQLPLNPVTEAALTGWDRERLAAMVARSGLAMAPIMAAQANFRGILTDNDYLLTIARGDLFPAYADPVREVARAIPSAGEFAELWLRGWLTQPQAEAGGALHGMTANHLDLLYKLHGRPVSNKQLYIGLARGGTFPSAYADIPEPFRTAAQQSNVRPEWASVWYEDRYSLPSAFVVRTLLRDGAIDAARAQSIFGHEGWPPDLAQLVAEHYAGGTTAAADPHIAKAHNTAWTKAQSSYISRESTAADVQPIFTLLGVPAGAQTEIVKTWDAIRALVRAQRDPAQIMKEYREQVLNPATGAAYTHAEAIADLLARGYDQADATMLLEQ